MAKQQDLSGSPGKDPNSEEFIVPSTSSYYQVNGLTVTSNNTAIIPRDSAGNIIIRENNINNPLLIIEPVIRQINKKSFLQTIGTRFKYFSFPAVVINSGNIDLPEITLDDVLIDPVYTRYKPSEPRKILTSFDASGILMDELVDGNPTQKINGYVVNKLVKNSGADLRFRIKLEHRFDTPDDEFGTAFFFIAKNNVDSGLNRKYLGPYYNSSFSNEQQQKQFVQNINDFTTAVTTYCDLILQLPNTSEFEILIELLKQSLPRPNDIIITPYTINNTKLLIENYVSNSEIDAINPTLRNSIVKFLNTYESDIQIAKPGQIGRYGVQSLFIDVTIPNSTLEIGDVFAITAYCNVDEDFKYHTINSDTSYWSITDASKAVDDWNQPVTGKE